MSLWKNTDVQTSIPKFLNIGQVEGVKVAGTMSAYVDGDAVTFDAAPAGGVTATGTIKVTAGAITGVTITNAGAGYTTVPAVTAPTGTGATLTAKIKPIDIPLSEIIFVDTNEAAEPANIAKGINTPGWGHFKQYNDAQGNLRTKFESLVAIKATAGNAGDRSDDSIVGDAATADNFAITTQPSAATVVTPTTAVFTIVATSAASYQWQVQVGGAGNAWVNVSTGTGGTTASHTTAATIVGNTGNRYRCVVTSASGATITSKAVKLTVTAT